MSAPINIVYLSSSMLIGTQQNPPDLLEIPTGLAALGMTEVVVSWLRRFQQPDKLKFDQYDPEKQDSAHGEWHYGNIYLQNWPVKFEL